MIERNKWKKHPGLNGAKPLVDQYATIIGNYAIDCSITKQTGNLDYFIIVFKNKHTCEQTDDCRDEAYCYNHEIELIVTDSSDCNITELYDKTCLKYAKMQ